MAVINANSFGSGTTDIWVLKLNADGSVANQRLLGGAGADSVEKFRITPSGSYVVVGKTTSFGDDHIDIWVFTLTEDGNNSCIEIDETTAAAQNTSVSGENTDVIGEDYGIYVESDVSLSSQNITVAEQSQCSE